MPEDPYCGLAEADQLASSVPELEILDPEEPAPETLIERARACEDAARSVAGITNSEGAEASWHRLEIALVTSNGFARALDTLAQLSRNEDDRTKVRKFLCAYVNHPNRRIQSGAIRALGALGDPKAIPVVEAFTGGDPSDRIQRAALPRAA